MHRTNGYSSQRKSTYSYPTQPPWQAQLVGVEVELSSLLAESKRLRCMHGRAANAMLTKRPAGRSFQEGKHSLKVSVP